MSTWASGVLPHGPLREVVPGLWQVTGSLPGMPLPRNMTVLRLEDGSLLLHSVVCLDEDGMRKLEALGRPRVMIVPNAGHRLDARRYKERYPGIQVICPRSCREKVAEEVKVDASCEEVLPRLGGVRILTPSGMKPNELIYDVDAEGGRALLVCDVLARGDDMPGFKGWVFGLMGTHGGRLGLPRIVRLFFQTDRSAFRRCVEGLAELPGLKAVALCHGEPVTNEVALELRQAAERV